MCPASSLQAPKRLVIASRESRLAMWQAQHVQAALRACYPDCEVSILGMTTRGDQILDRTLSKVGGKGLFVKELENALADGSADLAVHSLKDVPMVLPEGFTLAAIMERDDPRDALVPHPGKPDATLETLPPGAVVGTASLRREAMVRARYPHLDVRPLRGNLDTRLAKLDRGEYQAIILAAAGLKRLGLGARIGTLIDADASLPAAGQGALGIEVAAHREDLIGWLAPLHDVATACSASAERMVSRLLGGSCEVPLAAYADRVDGSFRLRARLSMPDGTQLVEGSATGKVETPDEAEALGREVARQLLAQGGDRIVAALSTTAVTPPPAAS